MGIKPISVNSALQKAFIIDLSDNMALFQKTRKKLEKPGPGDQGFLVPGGIFDSINVMLRT